MQLDRLEVLNRLISAGWGYHPGRKIPAHVQRAAANPRAVVPRADAVEARQYERRYHDSDGEISSPQPAEARPCVICGTDHRRHSSAKTCSYDCAEKLRAQTSKRVSASRRVPKTKRLCVQCGETFLGHEGHCLCSDKCRKARRRQEIRDRVETRAEERRKERENRAINGSGMMDFAGKISPKALEYKQEVSHVG